MVIMTRPQIGFLCALSNLIHSAISEQLLELRISFNSIIGYAFVQWFINMLFMVYNATNKNSLEERVTVENGLLICILIGYFPTQIDLFNGIS